jgi:uncharacterized membrane protein
MSKDLKYLPVAELKRRGMSAQEVLDARRRRPLSNRVGSRRFRRRLVVGTYAGWLLIAAIMKLMTLTIPGWSKSIFGAVFVLVAVNSMISLIWLNRRTYINTPALPDSELDERLVQIRNQAFRTAFQIFVPVVIIAWALSVWTVLEQPNNLGITNALIFFYGAIVLGTTLPTAIIAWREPDPPETEESA